jgi:hypothetical protein
MSVLKFAAVFSQKTGLPPFDGHGEHRIFTASADATQHLPFATLVLGSSPSLLQLGDEADAGLYLVSERTMLNQPLSALGEDQLPGCVGIFPMIANPKIGPAAADNHWHQNHAPLALNVHLTMTHYYQLQVVHRFGGPDWNGLALCCCISESDLRERFYGSDEGKRQIGEDIVKFADTKNSPRRVIATVQRG